MDKKDMQIPVKPARPGTPCIVAIEFPNIDKKKHCDDCKLFKDCYDDEDIKTNLFKNESWVCSEYSRRI